MILRKMILSFLSAWVAGLLFSCSSPDKPGNGGGTNPPAEGKGDVTIYVTTNDRSYDFKKTTVNYSDKSNMSPTTITLNRNQRYQTIDGFGAAITGSTAYNLLKMKQADRTKFLTETFSPIDGMGYSYVRVPIGCSDFSLSEYTCWDNQAAGFSLTNEENNYVIPVLKEILAINPNLKVLGSPWTCPIWMKNQDDDGNPWNGGTLKTQYYTDYAGYFVKWIQAFKQNGVTIYSITPQNEPLNRGNSASLFMSWQEQRDFVRDALLPQLKAAGLSTKIYLFDHNYNYDNMTDQYEYPVKIYDAGVTDSQVAGAAYHDYGGNKDELLKIHNKYPNKELIFTETSIGTWNDGRNLAARLLPDMENIALGTVNNWCKAVIVWNLMLDTDGAPNRPGGCTTCYGAVDISKSNYSTITRNSHYYIIGHLASVVKPGATRIGTSGYTANGLTYAAFENIDGLALVLVNNTSETKKITIDDTSHHFLYEIPAYAVVSYRWGGVSTD